MNTTINPFDTIMIITIVEAYEVGFDFVFPHNNNHKNHPHSNLRASHSGEGPSCLYICIDSKPLPNLTQDIPYFIIQTTKRLLSSIINK